MDPMQRVSAFIADYETIHNEVRPLFEAEDRVTDPFLAWAEGLDRLCATHGSSGFTLPSNAFLHHLPDHTSAEQILTEGPIEGGVRVSTRSEDQWFEYDLVQVDGSWKIAELGEYLHDPGAPAIDEADSTRLAEGASRVTELSPATDREDMEVLFRGHTFVDEDGEEAEVTVQRLGAFHAPSGVLAIGDLGYDLDSFGVLTRSTQAGHFTVDFSCAYDRVAALRVNLTDGHPTRWLVAAAGDGTSFPVDSGNLAIVDWQVAASLTIRTKESAFNSFADDHTHPARILTTDEGTPFGAISISGWGDGSYPAYWGVDDDGTPVQLVIDYGVIPGATWNSVSEDDDDDDDDLEPIRIWDEDPSDLSLPEYYANQLLRIVTDQDPEALTGLDRPDPGSLFGAEVTTIGTITCSGAVIIGEAARALHDELVVVMPSGSYDISVAVADSRESAFRMAREGSAVSSWIRAGTQWSDIKVISPEMLLLDLTAARSLTFADQMAIYESLTGAPSEVRGLLLDPPTGAIVRMGSAQRRFPAYIGLDAEGVRVQLVVDFGVVPGAAWAEAEVDLDDLY